MAHANNPTSGLRAWSNMFRNTWACPDCIKTFAEEQQLKWYKYKHLDIYCYNCPVTLNVSGLLHFKDTWPSVLKSQTNLLALQCYICHV